MSIVPLLNFDDGVTIFQAGATSLNPNITFTRASSATDYVDPSLSYGTDVPVLNSNGWLIQGARTNLLLNSATLSTQSITVTAVAHTLSFFGTGTVTLSGASTAGPLVGTGANNRVQLTFTPSAGSLTLTVTGDVRYANCNIGTFADSWISTAGATATRANDVATISDLSTIGFNSTEFTVVGRVNLNGLSTANRVFEIGANSSNRCGIEVGTGTVRLFSVNGGALQAFYGTRTVTANTTFGFAAVFKQNGFLISVNGLAVESDPAGLLPASMTSMRIGYSFVDAFRADGYLQRLGIYPTALSTTELQALSAV